MPDRLPSRRPGCERLGKRPIWVIPTRGKGVDAPGMPSPRVPSDGESHVTGTTTRESIADDPAPMIRRRRVPCRLTLVGAALAILSVTCTAAAAAAAHARERQSAAASRSESLSNAYQDALYAATVEQSLERAYQLGHQASVLAWHRQAAAAVDSALTRVAAVAPADTGKRIESVRTLHAEHLRRFAAATAVGATAADAQVASELAESLQDQLSASAKAAYLRAVEMRAHAQQSGPPGWLLLAAAGAAALGGIATTGLLAARRRRDLHQERDHNHHRRLHDSLTGLPNRTLLNDRLGQAVITARRERVSTALLLLDLDRFKDINSALGHDYGDLLLAQIGPRLRGPLRDSDTVARLGGDEFAIVLPRVHDVDAAMVVADRLQQILREPFLVHGMPLSVEASIGVAVFPDHGEDVRSLTQHADVAMYVAKSSGAGVAPYQRELDGHTPGRATLLGDLRRALDDGELSVHYQGKHSVRTGNLVGVEALVRWEHPQRGLLLPQSFLPLAERTGLIHPLTSFVLGTAISHCRRWLNAGTELPVAVNVSARTLLDPAFATEVERLLDYWALPPRLLVLEITEGALMTEPEHAGVLLERLATLGVALSIDDFGTGYSSLSRLRSLPVQELKIDQTFVTHMLSRPNDAFIVRSVINLGHDVGLRVVAEGVENDATLQALDALGCDVAQGFGLSVPQPESALGIGAQPLAAAAGRPRLDAGLLC